MSKTGDSNGLATMVARYRAHNDAVAERHGMLPKKDPVAELLQEAQDHLARARRAPSERKVLALQDAVQALTTAVANRHGIAA